MIKRMSRELIEKSPEHTFETDFEKNKNLMKDTGISKKTKNQVAGYVTRLQRNTKKIIEE